MVSERASAEIIAFPRAAVATAAPGPEGVEDPQIRLREALAALNAALAVQRDAVASWRGAIGELSKTMQGLSRSLRRCQDGLDGVGESQAADEG